MQTRMTLQPHQAYQICTRLDFDFLLSLTAALRSDKEIARQLRYWPNSSLHRVAGAWHYVETRSLNKDLTHHLVKIEADSYVDAVIKRAANGATIRDVIEALLSNVDPTLPVREVEDYVATLVENQVLVPSLFPLVTGEPALDDLIRQLEEIPAAHDVSNVLKRTRTGLLAIDRKGLGADMQDFSEISTSLVSLPTAYNVEKSYQTDMLKPAAEAALSETIVKEIADAVHLLSRFDTKEESRELASFRDAFSERYGISRVPLLEALDDEAGIGFGQEARDDSSLLSGMRLERKDDTSAFEYLRPVHAFLLKKVSQCLQENSSCLDLTDDLPPFSPERAQRLPDSFCINSEIVAPSMESINKGTFEILLNYTAGPDGARALARFCHLHSSLTEFVSQHLREEEAHNPDAVYAEIVHLPEWRIGNVLSRPVLRGHEVVYLGRSGASADQQIPASDLLVAVEDGEIRVYSSKFGRRVIPRMTTAHGFHLPYFNPVYRFLCFLQLQHGVSGPVFSWGPLDSLEYLPRVRIGRVVLAVARWRIEKREIDDLGKWDGSGRFARIQDLRERHQLPRFAALVDSDNVLFVDFHNPLSVEACLQVMNRLPEITFQEIYPTPDKLCVASVEGSFWHELFIPLVCVPHVQSSGLRRKEMPKAQFPNREHTSQFAPGDAWLYIKLYGGLATLDEILKEYLPGILRAAKDASCFSHWFFIRYADPREHLRVRFHGNPDRLLQELLPMILNGLKPLSTAGRLWKIQLDTYQRETARYGGEEGVIEAEHIFCADSEAVLNVLGQLQPQDDADMRWRLGLLGVDSLLRDFGLDLAERLRIMEKLCSWSHSQFKLEPKDRIIFGKRFREEKHALEPLFADQSDSNPVIDMAREVFVRRSRQMTKNVESIRMLVRDQRLFVDMSELVGSYVHMHVNRLVRSQASEHEVVLYDFLLRLYRSTSARSFGPASYRKW
jgi:thiopeptide-type bacteriocin biosynthesis protein